MVTADTSSSVDVSALQMPIFLALTLAFSGQFPVFQALTPVGQVTGASAILAGASGEVLFGPLFELSALTVL